MTKVLLLTGQYGTCHSTVGNTLCRMASEKLAHLTTVQPIARFYSVEQQIWLLTGAPEVFFELPNDAERDQLWHDAFTTIRSKIEEENPLFAFLSFHAVHFWKKRFFSCVDWDRLLTIQPQVILTLVDDIYDIHTRITEDQTRKGVGIPRGQLTLQELLSWRLREIHTCNLIAKHLRVNPEWFPSVERFLKNRAKQIRGLDRRELDQIFGEPGDHYVLSVKQDAEDFYRLLFARQTLRVYSSFPISAPRKRNDTAYFEDLQRWREHIHREFVVFDPLAIDEARFIDGDDGVMEEALRPRIPYGIGTPIVPSSGTPDAWPLSELRAIREGVIQQVGERDYKLESQADLVAMWRPLYGKDTHDGVDSEGVFAAAKRIPTHSYHPKVDRTLDKPFPAHYGVPHANEAELLEVMRARQRGRREKQTVDTY